MPITPDIPAAEVAIVEMTNAYRRDHKLSALAPNAQLVAAARAYARALAARTDLPHTLAGTTPATRAAKEGYTYCQLAENLARASDSRGFTGADFAKRAMKGWKASPGHRKNLLLPHLTEIGVAVAEVPAKYPTYVAVQMFGRPAALKYKFKVRNDATRAVPYEFAGKHYDLQPGEYMRHEACVPHPIAFTLDKKGKGGPRIEPRAGQTYTLTSDAGGGVKVEAGAPKQAAEPEEAPEPDDP